jgi:serine/threonine protein kinase
LDEMLHPMLSDFGLPARVGAAVSPYLAPEQVQGGIVDRRADIYALGVLLYTTLVGAEPPAGMVVSPRSRRPDIPESVERVIFKAMAQNPDQRFQSATEFLSAMQTAFESPLPAPQPVYAPPPPPPPPPAAAPTQTISQTVNVGGEKKGTNWVGLLIGVIFVLILCIGAIYSYRVYMENQGAAPVEPTQPAAARPLRSSSCPHNPGCDRGPATRAQANKSTERAADTAPEQPPTVAQHRKSSSLSPA